MAGEIFVDSTAWIALLHRADSLHVAAAQAYERIFRGDQILVTTSLVLVEVASALAAPGRRKLATELENRLRMSPRARVVFVDKDIYDRSWQLYRERNDKTWSLVDCASFVVMHDLRITEALVADHHFEPAGFVKLL